MEPRRLLVTGAAGLIGGTVLRQCAGRYEVVALDRVRGEEPAARWVVGDLDDPETIATAVRELDERDAVVHCAAIPAPTLSDVRTLYAVNALGTLGLLVAAAERGVRRFAQASSMSVYGHAWSPAGTRFADLPVDESAPLQIADVYALSKHAAEGVGDLLGRRYAATVVSLRFPFVRGDDGLADRARTWATDAADGAAELWTYLHVEDAAGALLDAVRLAPLGHHRVLTTAPTTLAAARTADLLAEFYPRVPDADRWPGHEAPVDLRRARELFGFRARHVVRESESLR